MKFIVNKVAFIKDLAVGGSLAGRYKSMPVLDCVKIGIFDTYGEIVSSNIESTIRKRFDLVSPSEGSMAFCVEYDTFYKVMKSLPAGDISIDVKDAIMSISHANGVIEIPVSDVKSFPEEPELKADGQFDIDSSRLLDWASISQDFAASDELRPVMSGMYLYRRADEVGFCATDSHSLITDNMSDGIELGDVGIIVIRTSLPALSNICKSGAMIRVSYNKKKVRFIGLDGTTLSSTIVEGAYPNFKAVIPQGGKFSLYVDKEAMKEALTRSTTCINKSTCDVVLSISSENIKIETSDTDFNKHSVENIPCRCGGDVKVRLNVNKLLNCIGAIASKEVNIVVTDNTRPVIFKDAASNNKTVLLMTMTM
jgi:DNA polymerase-3 subunit beta